MYYKFRAKCKADFSAFLLKEGVHICCVYNIESVKDGTAVEIHLQTYLPFEELKEKLGSVINGHVMANTLEATEKYTGNQLKDSPYRTIDFEAQKFGESIVIPSVDEFKAEWEAVYSTPIDFKPKSKYEPFTSSSLHKLMEEAVSVEDYETASAIYIELKKRNSL